MANLAYKHRNSHTGSRVNHRYQKFTDDYDDDINDWTDELPQEKPRNMKDRAPFANKTQANLDDLNTPLDAADLEIKPLKKQLKPSKARTSRKFFDAKPVEEAEVGSDDD